MIRVALALLVLLISGCAVYTKVDPGEARTAGALQVQPGIAWNQINRPLPAHMSAWTTEGEPIDQLVFFSALSDGAPLYRGHRVPVSYPKFQSSMRTEEIVDLIRFEMSNSGSAFNVVELRPFRFSGASGFRLEFELLRNSDNTRLRGVAYGATVRGKFYGLQFHAPAIHFYPKLLPEVERIAASARIAD